MNYATLTKIKLGHQTPPNWLLQCKKLKSKSALDNPVEITFYLSINDPDQYYLLNFWLALPQIEPAEFLSIAGIPNDLASSMEILEHSLFTMSWDYRLVSTEVKASYFCIITTPAGISEAELTRMAKTHREVIRRVPGLAGVWVGWAVNKIEPVMLFQSSWMSIQHQQAFLTQPEGLIQRQSYKESGFNVEYGSFNQVEHFEYFN